MKIKITEDDMANEILDRKRKELREIHDKTTSQKIEYTELVKTFRKKKNDKGVGEKGRSRQNPFSQVKDGLNT